MENLNSLLIGAVTGLCGAIAVLWRQILKERTNCDIDKKESARLIFALLQRLTLYKGEYPPPTTSTSEKPNINEAKELALKELDGNIESMVKAYLESELPPPSTKR